MAEIRAIHADITALAVQHRAASIAFPSISIAAHGFPVLAIYQALLQA